jgi:hypothetical protein
MGLRKRRGFNMNGDLLYRKRYIDLGLVAEIRQEQDGYDAFLGQYLDTFDTYDAAFDAIELAVAEAYEASANE